MLSVASSQTDRETCDALSRGARRLKSMALHGSALARHQCCVYVLDRLIRQQWPRKHVCCLAKSDRTLFANVGWLARRLS